MATEDKGGSAGTGATGGAASGARDSGASADGAGGDSGGPDLERLTANLARIDELSRRLVAALAKRREIDPALQGPGQETYMRAASAWMAQMMADPSRMIEAQVNYWGDTLRDYVAAQKAMVEGRAPEPDPEAPADRRFAGAMWQSHPWFDYLRRQYQTNARIITDSVDSLAGLDDRSRKKVSYFARQLVDMMSPTNFLGTNPEALAEAIETDGQSLIDGLENLVRDIERNNGEMVVTLSDPEAFEIGRNLATSPGKVVFRNRLIELIQYAPATEQVYERPLLIFPPWINKFYILDLSERNSMIRWLVGQGFTVFVVSWVDPDASYADYGLDDYVAQGYFEAIRITCDICKTDKINAVGYCIAGTTLALTLAWLQQEGGGPVEFGNLLHHADRLLGPGRVLGVSRRRFRRRDRTRGDVEGRPRLVLHEPDVQLPALERPDLAAGGAQLHDGQGAAGLRPSVLER